MTDISKLRALLEKATNGPWTPYLDAKCVQIDFDGKNGVRPCIVGWGGFDSNDLPMKENRSNASLICALRNEAPALLDEVDALRAALQRIYGMAERPMCLCGTPTGTAAIKEVARKALGDSK